MGVDPDIMEKCKGLHFQRDYVHLWDWFAVDHLIKLYKTAPLDNLYVISEVHKENCNYELKITINNNEICFEQCSVNGIWTEIWRENVSSFDGESVDNITYALLAAQNGRL